MGTLSGIGTLVLLLAFIGLCVWAWNPRQKKRWDESARLALEDDPAGPDRNGGSRHE